MIQRLRDRVAFQRLEPGASDGAGNTLSSWSTFYACAARLRPINGREEVLAGKLAGVQPFELIVRPCQALKSLTTADRVVIVRSHQMPTYAPATPGAPVLQTALDVTAIQNTDERGRWLSILCRAGVASG